MRAILSLPKSIWGNFNTLEVRLTMDSDEILPEPRHLEEDLDEKYPNRPRNNSPTLPFHELYLNLFHPLSQIKKKPATTAPSRRKIGPHNKAAAQLSPYELRRDVIARFISRWRKEVGNDIYPAFRLILPDKDRDRPMYGMKEKVIGKMLVKIMKINKESEDGDMSIEEVNDKLDKLAATSKEDEQTPILAEFYRRMNPEELMWLIRIILRQMKVGASERTLFHMWHPDAENLYTVSSSLRRVCWELYDPNIRLEAADRGITLMQCFQPQLAQFQMHSFDKMIMRMQPTEEDPVFWIEEKLDGERMQLHMAPDDSIPGGRRFAFWSRKAKEYTYLYGEGIYDEKGALTRHLKDAFVDGVQSVILDGEMVTWDPEQDAPVAFGTLKTAALAEQRNPFTTGPRPMFRVFDILYLNGKDLTKYTLRDRRNALKVIRPVHRRFEIHPYQEASTTAEIEACLRNVVAEASEGLVLKNPRSPYRLNERHDDWMKVKPEYMTEFGESLDLVIVGGYYGQGHRGGYLGSFLCGLRVDDPKSSQPMKCWSFCKVGGGFTAADYQEIRHHTDGKWMKWDPKKPPTDFIELSGGDAQNERPDMWIRPSDSVVICVKAASVGASDMFRMGQTLRFPRFKKLRKDKNWKSALSIQEFLDLKSNVEQEHQEKAFNIDNSRRKRVKRVVKKPLTIAGYEEKENAQYIGPSGRIFDQLNFFIMTDASVPEKHSKGELEQLVKANGGKIFQTNTAVPGTICIAERRTVKVASLLKSANSNIVRPSWLIDCVKQNEKDVGLPDLLLPFEPRHMFFVMEGRDEDIIINVDPFDDSYARDTSVDELKEVNPQSNGNHPTAKQHPSRPTHSPQSRIPPADQNRLRLHRTLWLALPWPEIFLLFGRTRTKGHETFDKTHTEDIALCLARNTARFASAHIATSFKDPDVTHVIVNPDTSSREDIASLRGSLAARPGKKIPHLVSLHWVQESWKNGTLLDEERFSVSL
ncbi:Nucleic acid-binding OB-fold [Penicillium maclennaniae]|uniref:Nucleic acid-binding OB-fold n=1 Tax=Penicillium maclennaniae TaxID=1343394 RepID=UPI00253FF799|nr:Nucleic acid-binding OB-fold [Penicillium maclennaniae]KAJ5677992.1 Nucleic acid-binding OB-fold [Penicillium maclennaniae]